SKLSHIVRSAAQSEEEDNTDDIIQMPPDDLILPELDQNAAEVREYISSPSKTLDNRAARKHKVNLSTIREKYREARLHESAMKIKINLLMADKPIDALKSKLVHLAGTIVVLLYNGLSAFQYCEVTFGNVNYSILDSLYVVMVTLSTTEGSRVVMMLLIVISLAVLPSLIADALSTLRKRNDWGGYVSDSSKPFILIVGSFRAEQVTEILDGFLNTENTEPHLNVVFLDINKPNEELKFLERNSMWGHRIQFIHGSVLVGYQINYKNYVFIYIPISKDEQTLKRVEKIDSLSQIDQHASDPQKEDERNTVRLWSLYCHTVVHNVDIYTYNLSPYTAVYQKMAKEIICVREFKQYLIAMSCRCRGASTLLTNLLHQRRPMDHYDESWQAQYDDGSCNEIYMDKPPLALVGLSFKEAAWVIYTECQVILFGVKTYLEGQEHREMLLNPENNYVIKDNDLCVYMCESPRELDDVNSLVINSVRQKIDTAMATRIAKKTPARNETVADLTVASETSPAITSSINKDNIINNASLSRPGSPDNTQSIHRVKSDDSNQTITPIRQKFQLLKLPTPRMALLTGNRRIVRHLDELPSLDHHDIDHEISPMCYLLEEPADLDSMTIESAENLSGHIVVCMHQKVSNIFKFIFNLRSPQLKPNELQDIVFLCTSKPTEKIFESLCRFPKVHFMLGNCQHPEDLVKAGVKRAKQVVIMSESECLDLHERTSDSPAVMTSHLVDLLLQDRPHGSSRIVNLVEKSNIRFMHLLQGKDVAEEIDVFYTPAYAAGNVIVDSLLSNVLLSQTYYKPDIVSVIKALCGMPGPLYNKDTSHMLMVQTKTHPYLFKNSRHLMLVLMPPAFVDKPFSVLFESLILDHEVLTLGLLRAPDENMGNELSFVYTNPVPSLVLKRTDRVYVLASPGWKIEKISDALVGDLEQVSSISVEELERLTIAAELIGKPNLLFLDESTSGLDAQLLYNIMCFIHKLADAGWPVLCTIHQPSSTLFEHFDHLVLLVCGMFSYFKRNIGPKCSSNANFTEYILEYVGAGSAGKVTKDWSEV
ncbi:hypothetical protein CU098_001800, partial [Rhizopus stolonifer]